MYDCLLVLKGSVFVLNLIIMFSLNYFNVETLFIKNVFVNSQP